MRLLISGLEISNLQKADNSATILVDIIANHLTPDEDDELVLKEAFDDETVKNFLDIGVIEYWHESRNPNLTKEEKNKALLGKPVAFRWESGKPIVTASLTKSHPIVQDMLPHLEAKQSVYAGSIGGSKMVLEAKDSDGKTHRIIPKIKWDHLAIAPSPYVINRAGGVNVRLLKKAQEIICEFDNFNSFLLNNNIINKEEELIKALDVPASSFDLYTTPGGVITKQSLEKNPIKITLSEEDGLDFIDAIINIKNKKIPLKKNEYIKHFEGINKKDFGNKSFNLISKYFKLKEQKLKMTKEELLSKGISEKDADEIIAALQGKNESSDDSLMLLEKALNKTEEQKLSKAKNSEDDEGDEEDDDENYDAEYMKKYMKRFMKENKKTASKAAKDVGLFEGEMKKAIEDIDSDAEGAVVEMIELAPILNKQAEFNESMCKAIQEISSQVALISEQSEKGFDIMEKAARVQIEQAKSLDAILSLPQGRKGVTADVKMSKATELTNPEQKKIIYQTLMKATKNGDRTAGQIISVYESSGQKIESLTSAQKQYINNLMAN